MLVYIHFCSASPPQIKFLSIINRFGDNNTTDYYFSCSVVGHFLVWQYNNEPLSGFLPSEVGKAVVISASNFNYTATLLSSHFRNESGNAKLDSILVVSMKATEQMNSTLTCSNERNITYINTSMTEDVQRNVVFRNATEGLILDYIYYGDITSSGPNNTHIFLCGAESDVQIAVYEEPPIESSSRNHSVTTLWSSDEYNTVTIQGINTAEQLYNVTALFIVAGDSAFHVACYYPGRIVTLYSLGMPLSSDSQPTQRQPTDNTFNTSLASHSTEQKIPIKYSTGNLYLYMRS